MRLVYTRVRTKGESGTEQGRTGLAGGIEELCS